jgi:hypothetical protein
LLLLYSRAAHRAGGRPSFARIVKALWDVKIVAGAACFIAAFVLANNLIFNLAGYREHLAFNSPGINMLERAHPLTIAGIFGLTMDTLRDILATATYGVAALFVLGMGTAFLQDRYKAFIVFLPAFSYFVVFIGYIGFMEPRYVTPMVHVLAIFGGKFLADLLSREKKLRSFRLVLAGAAVAYILLLGYGTLFLFKDDPRYEAEKWIQDNIPEGAKVCSMATPDHTMLRLPPGRDYAYVLPFLQVMNAADIMRKLQSEYLVLQVFPTNMNRRDGSFWLGPLEMQLTRNMKLDVLEVFEPGWPLPAVSHLYINPYIVIAKRGEDF